MNKTINKLTTTSFLSKLLVDAKLPKSGSIKVKIERLRKNEPQMLLTHTKLSLETLGISKKDIKKLEDNNFWSNSAQKEPDSDNYTFEILRQQYDILIEYVKRRIQVSKQMLINIRLPSIPEDISENLIKFIIHYYIGDTTTKWQSKGETGDLISLKEGKQECKCFTSDGPISFSPSSIWNCIYFLDARKWLDGKFVLYRIKISNTSEKWKHIQLNKKKKETFATQSNQQRRPRICWNELYEQVKKYNEFEMVFNGRFDDLIQKRDTNKN